MKSSQTGLTLNNKPHRVRQGIALLWASAAIVGVLTLATGVGLLPNVGPTAETTITNLITIAMLAVVALKLAKRRNWARWFFVVVYGLGSGLFLLSLLVAPEVWLSFPLWTRFSAPLQFVLQTLALIFMFSSSANQWFRSR